MVLAQKQTYRSMPRNKRAQKQTHTPIVNLSLTRERRIYKGEKAVSSVSSVGKDGKSIN